MNVPDGWPFLLLALGAMRLTRLIGWDNLTERWRSRLTGYYEDGSRVVDHYNAIGAPRYRTERQSLMTFLHCPWCLGFWICLGVYGGWLLWPGATLAAMTPLALSAVVGLVVKNLDE